MCALQAAQRQEAALRALHIIVEDIDDAHVAPILQQLLPAIPQGAATGHTTPRGLALALGIVHTALQSLAHMSPKTRNAVVSAASDSLGPLIHMLCSMLSKPLTADDPMCVLNAYKACMSALAGLQFCWLCY